MLFNKYTDVQPKAGQRIVWVASNAILHVGSVYVDEQVLMISDTISSHTFTPHMQERMYWVDYEEFWRYMK